MELFQTGFLRVLPACACLAIATATRAATFDFESATFGATTPLVLSDGGLSATFNSPDTSVFVVSSSFFSSLQGQVFLDADLPLHTLTVTFSSTINYLQFNFALNDPGNTAHLNYTLYSGGTGGTVVGSGSANGTAPGGGFGFPEGLLAISGSFDAIGISATSPDFAIDNLNTIPEPPLTAALMAGLAALALWRRRRGRVKRG